MMDFMVLAIGFGMGWLSASFYYVGIREAEIKREAVIDYINEKNDYIRSEDE